MTLFEINYLRTPWKELWAHNRIWKKIMKQDWIFETEKLIIIKLNIFIYAHVTN